MAASPRLTWTASSRTGDRDPNREVSGIKANSLLTRPEFHGRASTTLGFEITWLC